MKKQFWTWLFVVVLTIFSISCACSNTDSKTKTPVCSIQEIVPAEIIVVKLSYTDFYTEDDDPTQSLTSGIAEVSQKYVIKNAVPITKKWGYGAKTAALLLFVEPRKK